MVFFGSCSSLCRTRNRRKRTNQIDSLHPFDVSITDPGQSHDAPNTDDIIRLSYIRKNYQHSKRNNQSSIKTPQLTPNGEYRQSAPSVPKYEVASLGLSNTGTTAQPNHRVLFSSACSRSFGGFCLSNNISVFNKIC